jgi:Tfp pilus assembly protein PilN
MKGMALELVSHSIENSQPRWSEILLELAAVVPPRIALKSMTIRKIKSGWSGDVCGSADGQDEITSLVLVEELQNNFLKSPLFTGTKVVEKKLEGEKINFKITYQLKS